MDLNARVSEWINLMKFKPTLVIPLKEKEIDYSMMKIYTYGYLFGLENGLDIKIAKNISIWFQKKNDLDSESYFPDDIPYYYKNKSDRELMSILLSTMEQYFIENPEWHKISNNN